jgi:hypothetical protein
MIQHQEKQIKSEKSHPSTQKLMAKQCGSCCFLHRGRCIYSRTNNSSYNDRCWLTEVTSGLNERGKATAITHVGIR